MNTIKSGKWLLSMAVPALLIGCQPTQHMAGSKPGVREIPRVTSAYLEIASPRQDPHPSTRLPIRRAKMRNFKILKDRCNELLKDVEAWDSDARLTGVDAADRDEVRATVAAFRDSLRNLSDAAAKSRRSDVREHYAAALASYRRLTAITESGN